MRGAPRAQHPRTRAIPMLAICVALCAAARADDADLGREVYDDFCVTCHGRDMVNPGVVTFDLRKFRALPQRRPRWQTACHAALARQDQRR